VFGGFLMHRAYDLALATCYTFAGALLSYCKNIVIDSKLLVFVGAYPRFQEVGEITFKKPVDIGDLVRLKSRVVYTSDDPVSPVAHVEITCQVG
jgi:acyl-coenzyme A thioesterase 9